MLYRHLWETGGHKLIAFYCTLKYFKKSGIKYTAYTAKNNKFVGGYSLLRAQTNISLSTLKKHTQTLIDMDLCFFDVNGDFVLLGGEKTKELYNCTKMVPVVIGKNLIHTQYNSFAVTLTSEERQQQSMITKKKYRSDLLKQANLLHTDKNATMPYKLYKKACKIAKKYGENELLIDNTILSNQGYAQLKEKDCDKKSVGQYWKSILVKKGIVKSSRRFDLIGKMSFEDYKSIRLWDSNPRLTYVKGHLAEETIASFKSVNIVPVKPVEVTAKQPYYTQENGLSHLSFDMIHFWEKM